MLDLTEASVQHPVLTDKAGEFSSKYNREHFQFDHGLSGHPLFALDSLRALAKRMPDHRDTYWSNGKVSVDAGWETGRDGRLSLDDTIAHIADNNSMVILKHAEQDGVYGPLLKDFLGRIVQLAGPRMRPDVMVGEVLILISSPNRVTPYHIDAETNYLVQVTGDKTICVFDGQDRTLVRHEELEKYFAGDHSGAAYRQERQKDATEYDLRAGTAVHIPPFSPHWVRNGNNVSVALSVNYELRSIHRLGRVYRMNAMLRRAGLAPTAPGQSGWRDGLKAAAIDGMASARNIVRRQSGQGYATWQPG